MSLALNPKGKGRVAARRWAKRLLDSAVVDGTNTTTHHPAEPAMYRSLEFRLVHVPGIPVDAPDRSNLKRVFSKMKSS